jgi:AraC-like DNA-binding protein
MSRSTLYRKLSGITKQSPLQFIRAVQLNKAADLLKNTSDNIAKVSIEMGYNNPSYFARIFKKQFGVSPWKYKYQQTTNNK